LEGIRASALPRREGELSIACVEDSRYAGRVVTANLTAEGKVAAKRGRPRLLRPSGAASSLVKRMGESARSKTVADTKPTRIDGNRKL
jgi:hypothetical protein